ncbi:hypothetical protein HBI56_023890 [Parastagonospora nodorum]|uniref:Uncharacterized protein n=1 Tax=Phaeosphaeria nodorum (strain SN15 / ATCC MYA-4574 / FGSC 10173) TaxID=321614 RepID=A0A7U2F5E9_PHANO|nr:hypothetical protein HBH56_024630 [Parastagonospora nodorum]QRC98811.1 hypothetical protein JI435_412600 [Parastagonospora nodorum SN15]KAH3934359.1 hypothetical protein HBH54_057390 [Parastagonospora nodorum]KAH3976014.1 hypothetical protein HBH51_080290 [Parastagonospora nodorum]KAH3984881.1 hypothetical protein HBH52_056190 [Parastagonospora nodorum]
MSLFTCRYRLAFVAYLIHSSLSQFYFTPESKIHVASTTPKHMCSTSTRASRAPHTKSRGETPT